MTRKGIDDNQEKRGRKNHIRRPETGDKKIWKEVTGISLHLGRANLRPDERPRYTKEKKNRRNRKHPKTQHLNVEPRSNRKDGAK